MIKKAIIGGCMLALISLSALSQVQGKIEGIVTDKEGNPLENVVVSIMSTKITTRHFENKTNKEGKFIQVGLWPGFYQVSFKKSGYLSSSNEVKVSIAESTRLVVTMEKAEKALERMLSDADKLFLQGNKLYAEEKYEKAASSYEEAIKLNESQWGYHFNLGLCLKKMGNIEDSIAAFQKALELNPESFSCNKELGEALAKTDDYSKAKEYYLKAIEISSDDSDAFYNFGVVLTNLGESEEALKQFLKAVELNKDYAEAYYQIGTIYIGQNNVEEAVKNLEKFLEIAPDHKNAEIAKQLLSYLKK